MYIGMHHRALKMIPAIQKY